MNLKRVCLFLVLVLVVVAGAFAQERAISELKMRCTRFFVFDTNSDVTSTIRDAVFGEYSNGRALITVYYRNGATEYIHLSNGRRSQSFSVSTTLEYDAAITSGQQRIANMTCQLSTMNSGKVLSVAILNGGRLLYSIWLEEM